MNLTELPVVTGDQAFYRSEDIQLGEAPATQRARSEGGTPGLTRSPRPAPPDYKNNILKERAALAHCPLPAKHLDLDKGGWPGGSRTRGRPAGAGGQPPTAPLVLQSCGRSTASEESALPQRPARSRLPRACSSRAPSRSSGWSR